MADETRVAKSDVAARALRNLHAHCQDSTLGYRRAATDTSDDYFAEEFQELSAERERMADELAQCLRDMNEPVSDAGTPMGRVHRLWLDIVTAASGDSRERVLREVLRGESALEQAYDDALRAELPDDVRDVVKRQHRSVRRARNRFQELLRTSYPSGAVAARINYVGETIWSHPVLTLAAGFILACVIGGLFANSAIDRRR